MKDMEDSMEGATLLFYEPYAAAQSLKNFWTRLASTYGCIAVGISAQDLIVKPHWYAGWMTHILGLDLSHRIPRNRIASVETKGSWRNYGKVEVVFSGEDMKVGRLLLYLKKHVEFVDKLRG